MFLCPHLPRESQHAGTNRGSRRTTGPAEAKKPENGPYVAKGKVQTINAENTGHDVHEQCNSTAISTARLEKTDPEPRKQTSAPGSLSA